ncbi:2-keto-3-deoxy-L-rhamnonate aldolase [bacterium BMS3Bbin10]|nr:2-keto-3-deoxy-L-rhamnonate aldolase [bacterium BMS3Bbin10]
MAWVTYGVPIIVEQMGEAGYDAVLIDSQHGLGHHADLVNCLTAARAARLPALVRPLTPDAGLIGAALDAGAQGVVSPLVENVGDVEACVRAGSYPPRGARSWGPYRGRFLIDGDYLEQANDWVINCVQIETRGAMDNLDDILKVDGLDMVLVGPNDLALALTGARDIRKPEVVEACNEILKETQEHSVIAAIFANDIDYAKPLIAAGWDVISVGTDMGLLGGAAADVVKALKG